MLDPESKPLTLAEILEILEYEIEQYDIENPEQELKFDGS
jgi:hypothetical protein